jgi:hypothetical protein
MLIIIRALILSTLVFFFDYLEDLGTSPFALSLAIFIGTFIGFRLAKSRLTNLAIYLIITGLSLIFYFLKNITITLLLPFFDQALKLDAHILHAELFSLAVILAGLSSFSICRSRNVLTAETMLFVFGFIYFFSSHRQFNFQSPHILGTLAWNFAISPLALLTILGVLLLILVLFYLSFSDPLYSRESKFAEDPEKQESSPIKASGKKNWIATSSPLLVLCSILLIIGNLIYMHYQVQAKDRTSMGVGQGKTENQSPLGFNSALGASNQPTAVVRLEGDYSNNPLSPSLYLRETALSLYNGTEMVAAGTAFDLDVPTVAPDSHFKAENLPIYDYRMPLQQSIFALTDHKLSFAIDFPTTINPLQNPDPKRFKAAYKAYSMVPTFDLKKLSANPVGDPEWDQATRMHYLKTNNDARYLELANKITADISDPVAKATALTKFLSDKSIYTLAPGHDLPANGDQTAPYLFGDMRGYCVHFAHALTYLFRSIGIPARIATGYMTDLSQSRDGHILLRMSDRHAWSEIFISDYGWVPFDPKPEQVESHAETPVDMNLLEELMDLLGPGEEILPKDLTKGDLALEEKSSLPDMPGLHNLWYGFIFIIVSLMIAKLYLWFSWILPLGPEQKAKHYYRSLIARIYDLGLRREFAQTREEYRQTVFSKLSIDIGASTNDFLSKIYSGATNTEVRKHFNAALEEIRKQPLSKKIRALFSLRSLSCLFKKEAW